jgi:hypothetical protein
LQAGGHRFDPDWLHQGLSARVVIGSIPIGSTILRPIACLPNFNHSFHHLAKAPGVLFKNPEVLF